MLDDAKWQEAAALIDDACGVTGSHLVLISGRSHDDAKWLFDTTYYCCARSYRRRRPRRSGHRPRDGLPSSPPGTPGRELRGVAYGGGRFVAVGGTIMHSPDGDSWTEASAVPTEEFLRGVAWDGTRFVVVGDKSTIVYGDGDAAWTARTPAERLCQICMKSRGAPAVSSQSAREAPSSTAPTGGAGPRPATRLRKNAPSGNLGRRSLRRGRAGRHDHPQR